MDALLLILALAAQTADASLTCRNLSRGARELNPVLGQSCAQVVGVKAAAGATVLLLPKSARRIGLGVMAVGGAVGVTVTLQKGRR